MTDREKAEKLVREHAPDHLGPVLEAAIEQALTTAREEGRREEREQAERARWFLGQVMEGVKSRSGYGSGDAPCTAPKNAPGHAHTRPGVWDSDNRPPIAGKSCRWCWLWWSAEEFLARSGRGEG